MTNPVHSEPLKKNHTVARRVQPTGTPESRKIPTPQRQPSIPRKETYIAVLAVAAIALHLLLRYPLKFPPIAWQLPLYIALAGGGAPLLWDLLRKVWRGEFGSDLLAG